MISLGQAEYLMIFARNKQFPRIVKEMERIGVVGLSKYLGPDQKKRLYRNMIYNHPTNALKLLQQLPSEKYEIN